MPGDPTSRKDEELLSQIDELKARMDRLMRGGSSTSNSALLTDAVRPQQHEPAGDGPPNTKPVNRTRVRDLIGPDEREVVEVHPGPEAVVPFPEDEERVPEAEADEAESPEGEGSEPIEAAGSVISVKDAVKEPRSAVTTFDQLSDAVQQELARDITVPPPEITKKGAGLASRFGPAENDGATPDEDEEQVAEIEGETEIIEDYEDAYVEDVTGVEDDEPVAVERSNVGLVAAIWVFVALVSSAIVTLHFTGSF
jgi:hypothetical protein